MIGGMAKKCGRIWANPVASDRTGPYSPERLTATGSRRLAARASAQPGNGPFRGGAWGVAFGVALLLVATPAFARPCTEAIFDCGRNGDVTIKNAKALFSEGRSVSWIRSRCRASVVEPPGCDWAAHVGVSSSSGGNTTVLARNTPTYADTAPQAPSPVPTPVDPPVNRDNAKHGPTLAPKDPLDGGIFADEIGAAAQRYKLPPQLIRAVMMTESGGNPLVLSNKGAVGLMQLLPATAREMGVDDIHDVAQNLLGGARFLRVLANRFDGDLVKVLSAYHAGSTRVLGRDATPFAATDDYVRKVLRLYYQLRDTR